MTTLVTDHPYTPDCESSVARHSHAYIPKPRCAQRCNCGHTRFQVNVGSIIPVSVVCAKCGNTNRTATAYEEGYLAGATSPRAKAAI